MSYTNQTQHYGLPQYVGTDVPAWLTDVNGAFAAIDTGMNAAKVQADRAATAAGQAANDITSLQSTVGTQATQISAAAQAAATAQSTANTADGKADANTQAISGLDTRVEALEQGGGVDTHETTLTNVSIANSYGALFYDTISWNSILPAGKTYEDVLSVEAIATVVSSTHVMPITAYSTSGLTMFAPVSAYFTGTIKVILKP